MSSRPTAPRTCVVRGCPHRTNRPTFTLCGTHFEAVRKGEIKECPNCRVICDPVPAQFCPQCGHNSQQIREQRGKYVDGSRGWDQQPQPETGPVPYGAIQAVERVRKNISEHERECRNHETNTVQYLVMPIIAGLGWEEYDPSQVIKEFKPAGSRRGAPSIAVDIALMHNQKPTAFIEAKRLGHEYDSKYMDQLNKYTVHLENGKVAVLTNGHYWQICWVSDGTPNLRETVDVARGEAKEVAAKLNIALGKSVLQVDAEEPPSTAATTQQTAPDHDTIMRNLELYRGQVAKQRRVPLFVVLTNDVISQIAKQRPVNLRRLRAIHGVGPTTVEQHGDAIIAIVLGQRV